MPMMRCGGSYILSTNSSLNTNTSTCGTVYSLLQRRERTCWVITSHRRMLECQWHSAYLAVRKSWQALLLSSLFSAGKRHDKQTHTGFAPRRQTINHIFFCWCRSTESAFITLEEVFFFFAERVLILVYVVFGRPVPSLFTQQPRSWRVSYQRVGIRAVNSMPDPCFLCDEICRGTKCLPQEKAIVGTAVDRTLYRTA